jgi:methionyl-tRNA formyltransferase
VVTRPDRPSGRGRQLTSPPVAERALALGIRFEQPASINDPGARAMIGQAGQTQPVPSARAGATAGGPRQTVIVCAFGALIKEPLLSEHDLLNIHPSLLPRWRGAAPVERAIMAGDAHTGVSIMRLTAGLDSGPVCLSQTEPILPGDTYGSLAPRLSEVGGELVLRALDEAPPFLEQSEQGVTYAEKIGPEDRLLDPARPAVELERVIRALHPHIGARVTLPDGTLLGVRRAALVDADPAGEAPALAGAVAGGRERPPGVAVRDGRVLLDCSAGVLELLEVQPPGGRPMDTSSYLRGHGLTGRR